MILKNLMFIVAWTFILGSACPGICRKNIYSILLENSSSKYVAYLYAL